MRLNWPQKLCRNFQQYCCNLHLEGHLRGLLVPVRCHQTELFCSCCCIFTEDISLLPPLLEIIPVAVGIVDRPPILVLLAEMTGLEEKNFTCVDEFFIGYLLVCKT